MLSVESLSTGSNVNVSCKGDRDELSKLAAAEACNVNVLADSSEPGSSSLRPYLLRLESQYCGQLPAQLADSSTRRSARLLVPLLLLSSFVVRSAIDYLYFTSASQRTFLNFGSNSCRISSTQCSRGVQTILSAWRRKVTRRLAMRLTTRWTWVRF